MYGSGSPELLIKMRKPRSPKSKKADRVPRMEAKKVLRNFIGIRKYYFFIAHRIRVVLILVGKYR
jgi:hypothetical protein